MSSVLPWLLACVLAATPPIPERMREGLELLEAGETARAEAIFREVLRESPRHGPARLQLGRIALDRGDWDEAREHLEIAVASDPRRPFMAWYLLGRVRLLQGEPAKARQAFDEALERAPRFGPALVGRAQSSLLLEDFDGALESCRKAIDLGLRDRDVYLVLGDLHLRKMETSEALAAYGEALKLDPSAVEVVPSFALSALAATDDPALTALLEAHLATHPECEQTLYALGLTRLHLGDLAGSEKYFRDLTEQAPERSDAWYNLGLVLLRQGKEREGRAAMERFREQQAREDEELRRQSRDRPSGPGGDHKASVWPLPSVSSIRRKDHTMTVDYASDFADFGGVTYLNCAFQGPMPLVAAAAAEEALELKKRPHLVRDQDYFSYPDAYRAAVANLIGAAAADVAVTDSATHGVMILVNGLDWQPGDEVVLPLGEFPSNRFPWLSLERRGVKVREVPAGPGRHGLAALEAAITPRTRALAASWVAYSTGRRLEIETLAAMCRDRGVLFVVDASQGIGGLEFHLSEVPCDLLVCAGYKWLLGPYGLGFAYVEPELGERLELGNVNWFAIAGARDFNRLSECELAFVPGAMRFDVNETANFTNVAAGVESLRYLERVGVATVERHVASLLDRLVAGLPQGFRDAGMPGSERRSNILCIAGATAEQTERAADALTAERVFVSRREGTIRLSPHLFNTADEIDRVLEILERSGGA